MSVLRRFGWRAPRIDDEVRRAEESERERQPAPDERVAGERGESAVQRPPSLQSRVSNWLAVGLMGAVALGLLGGYYVHTLDRHRGARSEAQSSAREKAKGEMALRPLGRVDPPQVETSELSPTETLARYLGVAPAEPPPPDTPEAWLRPAAEPAPTHQSARSPAPKTPQELRLERQLAGHAFAAAASIDVAALDSRSTGAVTADSGGEFDALLRPSVTKAVTAQVLATQRLLLPKGAFLDCTLETAIDSSIPGMTTCLLATDSYSADGSVVLLERGTKLNGETRGQVRAGTARVFVLWTEARTPNGVVVPLASPGTDELGRSGLPGEVNRHFFERFGAAILVSVIDGAIQGAVQSQRERGNSLTVNPSSSSQVMTEVLKSTIGIPHTVVKPQGDRIQVLVARDLDFRSVYELRPATGG
jgi:type IV secretion system protein VirB10